MTDFLARHLKLRTLSMDIMDHVFMERQGKARDTLQVIHDWFETYKGRQQ